MTDDQAQPAPADQDVIFLNAEDYDRLMVELEAEPDPAVTQKLATFLKKSMMPDAQEAQPKPLSDAEGYWDDEEFAACERGECQVMPSRAWMCAGCGGRFCSHHYCQECGAMFLE